jgi:uncharacterized protein
MKNGIMYSRMLSHPKQKSFFLFGPRGTGKTTWIRATFPDAIYLDLLRAELYNDLLANPGRLEEYVPPSTKQAMIVIYEVQRVPALLYEVHRLIEGRDVCFALTSSSVQKLRRGDDVNLLAGRALTKHMYPLTAHELGSDFSLEHGLLYGNLPSTVSRDDPGKYLESYVATYLREEIQHEGLTRNLGAFSRFLESISFSQGQMLSISAVSRDASVNRKVVEGYVSILEDLMLAHRVSAFTKKMKRRPTAHPKFYFFDAGVYRAIRPKGPLDKPEEISGAALETLVFHELMAINEYLDWGYSIQYWRSSSGLEVDFVLYGKQGLLAIEVKHTKRVNSEHLRGLRSFLTEYPTAKAYLVYMGKDNLFKDGVHIIPAVDFFADSTKINEANN